MLQGRQVSPRRSNQNGLIGFGDGRLRWRLQPLRSRSLEGDLDCANFCTGVSDPCCRPDAVNDPPKPFKHLLSQPITVPSGRRTMVCKPVTLNTESIAHSIVRPDREVDTVAGDAYLRIDHMASTA